MLNIKTAADRINDDPDLDKEHYAEDPDGITIVYQQSEIAELRDELCKRSITGLSVSQYDVNILKGLKHEFVDKMIGAGVFYNLAGEISRLMNVMLTDLEDSVK